MQKPNKTTRPSKVRVHNFLPWLILSGGFALVGATMIASGIIGAYYYVAPSLPPAETIRNIPLQIPPARIQP